MSHWTEPSLIGEEEDPLHGTLGGRLNALPHLLPVFQALITATMHCIVADRSTRDSALLPLPLCLNIL